MRSEVAIAPDGTLFIADTGNATIRTVGGAASTEPSIIRSVAGRWAPRQNVELTEPLGRDAGSRGKSLYRRPRRECRHRAIRRRFSQGRPTGSARAHGLARGRSRHSGRQHGFRGFSGHRRDRSDQHANARAAQRRRISRAAIRRQRSHIRIRARIIPQGLAVDGGGNLFIAYTAAGGTSDQILRLDAFSSKLTVAARGLSAPGNISFDAQGNLFVANQGMRQVLKFNAMGVPATGVTLTPPANCPNGTTTYCDQVIGGSSPTAPFELSNNTASAITGVTAGFTAGNTSDFTISNSSCATSLAANSSCAYNVAFTPTALATTACGGGAAANTRCATFSVNYTGATAPLTAEASGVADDFQITCMTTMTFTCPPPSNGAPYQITISQGYSATFQLQIVPDDDVQRFSDAELPDESACRAGEYGWNSDDLRNFRRYHCFAAACQHAHVTGGGGHGRAIQCHVSNHYDERQAIRSGGRGATPRRACCVFLLAIRRIRRLETCRRRPCANGGKRGRSLVAGRNVRGPRAARTSEALATDDRGVRLALRGRALRRRGRLRQFQYTPRA